MGQRIEMPANGGTVPGYLAEPAAGGNGRGVVVIQEWWGLVPHIEDVADRFAAEGYVAIAPDLWHGTRTTSPDEAGRLLMGLHVGRAEVDLRGAIAAVQQRVSGKVGVIGFCMGGKLALLAATTNPDQVGAAVDFYGIHPKVEPDYSRLRCPVLGIFAAEDSMVDRAAVDELVAAVEAGGGRIEHTTYPGVDHAFFNDTRPEVYNPAAARAAWRQTLDFLGRALS